MDAIRLRDGLPVVFKRTPYNSPEIQMLQILSDRRLDVAENGAVDLLEVINIPVEKEGDPAEALIVMPKHIHFHRVQFHCRSEVAHFMRNVLEVSLVLLQCLTRPDMVLTDSRIPASTPYHSWVRLLKSYLWFTSVVSVLILVAT